MEEQMKTVQVVDIQFRPGQKVYFFDPAGIPCRTGDHVIIDTARGAEFGICVSGVHTISAKDVVAPLRPVLRIATAQDEKTVAENQAKEKRAYEVCSEKIREQNLDMQLVSAECAFDGSKILFFFTADERVDFRELVKNLAGVFHTRIELRQIGVRDKAKMVGGLGICGRPFCCATFLDDFQPVSIKMAKTQNLSLNPTKISGTCSRLMCCLKYEQDAYEDLLRTSPKAESFVDTPDGRGTVVEVDLLRQRVKVKMEEQPEVISVFKNEEIAILRNGKAKKTDPPIPADLAPISGGGRRRRFTLDEGKARGAQVIEVVTAGGLQIDFLPDSATAPRPWLRKRKKPPSRKRPSSAAVAAETAGTEPPSRRPPSRKLPPRQSRPRRKSLSRRPASRRKNPTAETIIAAAGPPATPPRVNSMKPGTGVDKYGFGAIL